MNYSNFAYKVLYNLIWAPSEHTYVPKLGVIVVQTNKYADSLGMNSYYVVRCLEHLHARGVIECIEVAHGEFAIHWTLPYKPCGCNLKKSKGV